MGASPLLSEVEFIAFDLETTGLSPVACRIVEFGAVRFQLGGTELGSFSQLVDPGCPMPWQARRVHGISDAMVCGRPSVERVLPRFLGFLGCEQTVLLAHNGNFDLGFLSLAMAKLGCAPLPNPVIDTLDLARKCLPGFGSGRLENLVIRLGIATSEEHRALPDSRLVMSLFRRIVALRPDLKTVGDLFCLSPPLGFSRSAEPSNAFSAEREFLEIAIRQRQTITMVYDGGSKGLSRRRITPRALLQSDGRPYLSAFCHIDQIEKTYRLDRIRELRAEESERERGREGEGERGRL